MTARSEAAAKTVRPLVSSLDRWARRTTASSSRAGPGQQPPRTRGAGAGGPQRDGTSTITSVALTVQTTSSPGSQLELLRGLAGDEADQAVRAGLDLHHGGHAIALDARDHAREAVAGGLGHDRSVGALATPFGGQARDIGLADGALPARGQLHLDATASAQRRRVSGLTPSCWRPRRCAGGWSRYLASHVPCTGLSRMTVTCKLQSR